MTDSKGPYKISHNGDWWDVNGPGLPISVPFRSKENAERYAKDKYQEWSVIHHTARREAIEEAIKIIESGGWAVRAWFTVKSYCPITQMVTAKPPEFNVEFATRTLTDSLRALLGAGEKEESK